MIDAESDEGELILSLTALVNRTPDRMVKLTFEEFNAGIGAALNLVTTAEGVTLWVEDKGDSRAMTDRRMCRECGCVEFDACLVDHVDIGGFAQGEAGGCYWVEADLCSACANPETLIRRSRFGSGRLKMRAVMG